MAFWRKHRFFSLKEQDEQDKVMAGSEFVVRYIGCTYIKEDFGKTEKLLMEFFKSVVEKRRMRKPSMLTLMVDLGGAVIYDLEGSVSERFQLCNIRYAISSEYIEEYSKYFVLVGRGESDLSVKAHVFLCENKKKAKDLYQIFIQTFTLHAKMKKSKESSESDTTMHALKEKRDGHDGLFSVHNASVNTPKACLRLNGRRNTFDLGCHQLADRNSTTEHHERTNRRGISQGNLGPYFEDGFTALARSRVSSSDTFPSFSTNQIANLSEHFPTSGDLDDVFR